ncbi:DUF3822 family protein [Weeksella virosa]|uniref:DUF3822 family protein n=1 Tax=Weeksella virosa TaxID=1014 RepID=UPI0025573A64|nr:DUF3822 family protein [Weeksella virosa]MDK7675771.1 DUF3822 family protein [Weeksella virosa]
MHAENTKSLALLLTPTSLIYATLKDTEQEINFQNVQVFRTEHTATKIAEKDIVEELKSNLVFRQSYHRIHLAFLTNQMQLIPNEFLDLPFEQLMQLPNENTTSGEKKNYLDSPLDSLNASIVYEISTTIKDALLEIDSLRNVQLFHSGKLFLDHLHPSGEDEEMFLNLHQQQLEIAVYKQAQLQYYAVFPLQSIDDFLYFTLVVLTQLELDYTHCSVYCFGEITASSDYYQQLKKQIRNVHLGLKDENYCENFTLYNLF